jgi:hypothetical protein
MRSDGLSATQILPTAQYDPEQVWDHDSIVQAQNLLLLLWVGLFGSLSSMFAVTILSLEANKSKGKSPGWGKLDKPKTKPKPKQARSKKAPVEEGTDPAKTRDSQQN